MADEKILDTENVSNFIHDIIDSDLAEGRVKEIHPFSTGTKRLPAHRFGKSHLDQLRYRTEIPRSV